MASWELLLPESALADVLPRDLAHFALPVRDALCVFLGGLPPAQQAAILRQQARLPASASFSQRLVRLAQASPVLHKLGQMLARDQRLPYQLRVCLRDLESLPPSVSAEQIESLVAQEFGDLGRNGIQLRPALAEASVAVVVPFEQSAYPAAHSPASQCPHAAGRGVLKILKPGIEQQLERELELLQNVGQHLDQRCEELGIPQLDYENAFQQASEKLLEEVRLEYEQRHLVEAQQFFADEPRVHIPQLLEWCSSRITAMEFISGGKVTDHGSASSRRQLSCLLAEVLIGKTLFSPAPRALFHADPHAGNLFLTDDGRLGLLDWSLVGRLGSQERTWLVQIGLAALTLNGQSIEHGLERLAMVEPNRPLLRRVVETALRRVARGQLPGWSWMLNLLDDAAQRAGLRVATDLLMFRKTAQTLDGLITEMAGCDRVLELTLFLEFLRHLALEYPQRCLHWPDSRDFSTRVSNLDLAQVCLGWPSVVARLTAGQAFDWMSSMMGRPIPVSR